MNLGPLPPRVHDLPELRGMTRVFEDRREAGEVLARMLAPLAKARPLVLAIPAGGVPVAAEVAKRLGAPLSVLVVSKATPPWNSEVGFGAVAYGGKEVINRETIERLGLSQQQVEEGLTRAREKVNRRQRRFVGDQSLPSVDGRTVILVDDGLATGYTLEAAIEALRSQKPQRLIVAIPTGHEQALRRIADRVDEVYCPNVRSGWLFAVADAYRHWHDVSEEEAEALLRSGHVEQPTPIE